MSIGTVTSFPELQSPNANTPVTVKHRKCGICCSGVLHTSVLPCVPGQMSKFLWPHGNSLHSDENNQSAPVYSALISKANQLSKSTVKTTSIVYTTSVSKAFEEDVYNVSWYSSDKFLEYESPEKGGVYFRECVCVSVRSRRLVLRQVCLPKGCWAEQCLPTSSTHATLSLPPWREMSQRMTRAELLTAGTRELLAKRLQQ